MKFGRNARLPGLAGFVVFLSIAVWTVPALASLAIKLAELDTGDVVLQQVELTLPAQDGRSGGVKIGRLKFGEHVWTSVALHCDQMRLADGVLQCRGGRLRGIEGLEGAKLTFAVDLARQSLTGEVVVAGGVVSVRQSGKHRLTIDIGNLRIAPVVDLIGRLPVGAQVSGRLNGQVERRGRQWSAKLKASELAFSDESGMRAAEGLALDVNARAEMLSDANVRWQLKSNWTSGDVFWNPVLVSGGWKFDATGGFGDRVLRIASANLSGPGLAKVEGSAEFDVIRRTVTSGELAFDGAELAMLVPQFVLPLLVPEQVERWQVAGGASGHLSWDDGMLQTANLELADVGFSYLGQRFRVGPIRGELPWRRGEATRWSIEVDGLRWQSLSFAPFALVADATERRVVLRPARLPLLDGALVIDALSFEHAGTRWQGSGSLYAEPISLVALTDALSLPNMKGTVSIAVPGFSVTPEHIGLDGTLVISVFDGYVQATRLSVNDPFGLLPRLTADVSAEHLDLAQLTQTFSFGSVSGFIDANVDDLVMARWKPVRFDANVRSSAGDYERRISQRAVENITALGGAGAMAAIQRSVLGLFSDFGYREIGLSCQLRGNVCQMAGLDGAGADDVPFQLVAGGGIPALDVIGYNRRVDWAELIERLQRAIADGAEPIVN